MIALIGGAILFSCCGLGAIMVTVSGGGRADSSTPPPKKSSRAPKLINEFRKKVPLGKEMTKANPSGLKAERITCSRKARPTDWWCAIESPREERDFYAGGSGRLSGVGVYLDINTVYVVKKGPLASAIFMVQKRPNDQITIRSRSYIRNHHELLDAWLRKLGQ